MAIWYVHRNGGPGTPISSAHQSHKDDGSSPMPDYCPEALDDQTSAELQAFLSAASAPPAPVLDAPTLAAALIASGGLTQAAIDSAVAGGNGSVVAAGVAAVKPSLARPAGPAP